MTDDIEERIEKCRSHVYGSATVGLTNDILGEDHHDLLRVARNADKVGTYLVQLDRLQQAKDWFATTAISWGHIIPTIQDDWDPLQSEPRYMDGTLTRAMLAEDRMVEGIAFALHARETDAYADKIGRDEHYYRPRILTALIEDDDEQARELYRGLQDCNTNEFTDLCSNCFDAILLEDPELVETSIRDLNEYHADKHADSEKADALLDHYATTLILTARRRNLPVTVESETIPQNLLEDRHPINEVDTDEE